MTNGITTDGDAYERDPGAGAAAGPGGTTPLLGQVSPNGNLQAIVQDDGRVVWLLLGGAEETGYGLRGVWVRNRIAAPDAPQEPGQELPVMPKAHTRQPAGAPALARESLSFVWLPEGNGVALYEGETLLAAIVPWSGLQGFPGYARDAIGATPVAFELPADGEIERRFAAAKAFWGRWDAETNPWEEIQESFVSAYEKALGKPTHYYAFGDPSGQGQTWPPRGLLRVPGDKGIAFVTVGTAIRPQPVVEPVHEDPRAIRRIEVGMMLPKTTTEEEVQRFGSVIAGLSELPWQRYVSLEDRIAIPTDALQGTQWKGLYIASAKRFGPRVDLPDLDGDPVTLLWIVPVNEKELEALGKGGSDDGIEYPRGPRLILLS